MRVKLSYTVEEENVLKEAAKIINLSSEDLTQCISLFNGVQEELKGRENSAANTIKAIEMIEEFRKALLAVDTRLSEVMEIVEGYDTYRRGPVVKPSLPQIKDADYTGETFGTD
jgi:hypothetical protein|tara:strand:+ start:579 stop:920 length:342 start_codon:yes stop_codon:yes gene_type:complete